MGYVLTPPTVPGWYWDGIMYVCDERVRVSDTIILMGSYFGKGMDGVEWWDTGIMTIWESLEGEGYPSIAHTPKRASWLSRLCKRL